MVLSLAGGVCAAYPAGPAAAREEGVYVVQLNAFKDQANANSFSDRLQGKGYPVYVAHETGDRFYKVRLGPFSSWESARQTARNLKRREGLSPLVLMTLKTESADPARTPVSTPPEPGSEPAVPGEPAPSTEPSGPAGGDDPAADGVDQVVARFLAWKNSWQEGDVASYLAFYSGQFDSGPKSFEAWKRSRARALTRNTRIEIEVTEIQIVPQGDRVEMSFIQKYRSSGVEDTGHKMLVWIREAGIWKIVLEQWMPV